MPTLIYLIVWERALFAVYGVNAESVAVIVSAFMLGLGFGALVGGKLSARFPRNGIILFASAELGTAVFGLFSLAIFHWAAAFSAGASLPYTKGARSGHACPAVPRGRPPLQIQRQRQKRARAMTAREIWGAATVGLICAGQPVVLPRGC